jgi:hypothetical protein
MLPARWGFEESKVSRGLPHLGERVREIPADGRGDVLRQVQRTPTGARRQHPPHFFLSSATHHGHALKTLRRRSCPRCPNSRPGPAHLQPSAS